jgi:hypothetical protein
MTATAQPVKSGYLTVWAICAAAALAAAVALLLMPRQATSQPVGTDA